VFEVPAVSGDMGITLTVQQRAERCRCGRYLAWWTMARATRCKYMRAPEDCPCEPTTTPAEECLDLGRVAEPEGEDVECE
jgi:hypothetical protein